ncbi:hypothetical protein F5882DRAFT_496039 [Hyaloscypha sp. PMI_1271]|nr:hypothetical protein F5882DRAFT_496039 [Hyaloscypha sp. PMI_1271]
MCLGTTFICPRCGKREYSIHPDLDCGENQPFPAWHHVRGRTYNDLVCEACIREEEEALAEEHRQIAQDSARAMAVKEYYRGQRPTPYTDEEARGIELQRSSENSRAHSEGRRLHPFTTALIPRTVESIRIQTAAFPDDQIMQSIPDRFAESLRRQAEIDTTGRAITNEDRLYSYTAVRLLLDTQTRLLEAQEPLPAPLSPARRARSSWPIGFQTFTTRHHQENPPDHEANALSPEVDLLEDVQRYIQYLSNPRYGRGHLSRFNDLFFSAQTTDTRNFDFVPGPNPGILVPTFREWITSEPSLLNAIQAEDENLMGAWTATMVGYTTYLAEGLATAVHFEAFVDRREEIADANRRQFNQFRPTPNFGSSRTGNRADDSGEPDILSFHQWVVNDYMHPRHDRPQHVRDLLEWDLDGYERWLRVNGSPRQISDFRILRADVDSRVFDFTPAPPDSPSFLTWLAEAIRGRRRRGNAEMIRREALRRYYREVVRDSTPEAYFDWTASLTLYYEENRREIYGNSRGAYSQIIEDLRAARDRLRELVLLSLTYWPEEPNPLYEETLTTRLLLRGFIATEHRPSAPVWDGINGTIRRAQRMLDEAEAREQEERINEMARNVIPGTPQTVDEDASTVCSSPPHGQGRQRSPHFWLDDVVLEM